MKTRRSIGLALRLLLLLPLLVGTLLLAQWSRTNDPRFFYFLTTPPGQFLAGVFNWHTAQIQAVHANKSYEEMTQRERQVEAELETELRGGSPSHHLVLRNGRSLLGRLLEEGPNFVRFQESFGSSGSLSARIQRSRILQLEPIDEPLPEITYRDVRFKMEFPELHFYKRTPYTIITDEKYFRVENTVRVLQRLHEEFTTVFEPVRKEAWARENIQVLFYSSEGPFRAYQKRFAPRMESSVGFYSPYADRFIVFNQRNSEQMQSFGKRLDQQAERYKERANMYGGAGRIEKWKEDAGKRMSGLAEQQTLETIRHEGAHQLFFTYGIHSEHRMENDWLYEGLAVYCETKAIGAVHEQRVGTLKEGLAAGRLLSVEDLVDHRSGDGLFAYGQPERVELAYSQSWALVHFLMQPAYRDDFFAYIELLRDRDQFWSLLRRPRFEVLCEAVHLDPSAFEQAWRSYLQRL